MFLDKQSVTVDAFCSTVKDCMSIDFSPIVYNSNFNLNGWSMYISNCIYWYIGSLYQLEASNGARSTMGWCYNSH